MCLAYSSENLAPGSPALRRLYTDRNNDKCYDDEIWYNENGLYFDTPAAIIDCETTGLNPDTCGIITLTISLLSKREVMSRTFYLNPEVPVTPEAAKIHLINDEYAKTLPIMTRDMAELICSLLSNRVLIGFNSRRYDIPVLKRILEAKTGRPFMVYADIDMLHICQLARTNMPDYKLETCLSHISGQPFVVGELHMSRADCIAVLSIMNQIAFEIQILGSFHSFRYAIEVWYNFKQLRLRKNKKNSPKGQKSPTCH